MPKRWDIGQQILAGIQRGMQGYMQGKAFGEQMQTSDLEQKRMEMANRLMQQQTEDYVPYPTRRQHAREDWGIQQEAAKEAARVRREHEIALFGMGTERTLETKKLAWNQEMLEGDTPQDRIRKREIVEGIFGTYHEDIDPGNFSFETWEAINNATNEAEIRGYGVLDYMNKHEQVSGWLAWLQTKTTESNLPEESNPYLHDYIMIQRFFMEEGRQGIPLEKIFDEFNEIRNMQIDKYGEEYTAGRGSEYFMQLSKRWAKTAGENVTKRIGETIFKPLFSPKTKEKSNKSIQGRTKPTNYSIGYYQDKKIE